MTSGTEKEPIFFKIKINTLGLGIMTWERDWVNTFSAMVIIIRVISRMICFKVKVSTLIITEDIIQEIGKRDKCKDKVWGNIKMETYMKAHGKEGKKLIGDLIDGKTGLCMKEDF